MPSIHDLATWEPLLRLLLLQDNAERLAAPGGYVAGHVGRGGWSVPVARPEPRPEPRPGRATLVGDMRAEWDAVGRVRDVLTESDTDGVSFMVETPAPGKALLHLFDRGPAVESGAGNHLGALVLVEGAVPEPWRRLPDPTPDAVPAPTADAALLERTLRERLPDAIGAGEEELAAAEERLGVALPEELKALYRVTRARWEDHGEDYGAAARLARAVGCELFSPNDVYVADAASRPALWEFGAMDAVETRPDAAVQGLVGSPGWIVFGDTGGGDRIAVDLTPGPRGHLGQVIVMSHEENCGAELVADSLTDMVLGRRYEEGHGTGREEHPPAVAWVNSSGIPDVVTAAHPGLEVLSIGVREGEPLSLEPLVGLPRLRTLSAYPGTLADPLEIARLDGLEFLELAPEEWRVLLAAGAVPRGLSAAAIEVHGERNPLQVVALANEILALWNRPPITRTTIEADLGPASHPVGPEPRRRLR
ncbi:MULTISPECIES: SMI1/KNR4 family protein [Streptomyces]|uniref:SMI1/KNR4 family protein n=1 Tax=Streptomyces sudanensis TaxID=436397 RepID=A0ABY4TEB1_9ACTN|nr:MULTISPECIES: SMI1/KNR4 family protein [Streptomyces]URN17274.1 SMI1/KNR4 family protein [Streptomyces sudanensis]